MIRSFCVAISIFISCLTANSQDVVHGHLIGPSYSFFNADVTRAVTVGKADIVLWDLASGKPVTRIDLGNKISQYDPFSANLKFKAVASRDLSKVLVELSNDTKVFGFLFDMNTGGLSVDDEYYNDKIYGFDSKNDYLVFRNLRTNNGPVGTRFEIGLANAKTTMGLLSDFKPRGFSLDGKIVYGEDTKSGKFVIYDIEKSAVKKTKLKFDGKNWYYINYPLLWTSKWTFAPSSYTEYYNIETGEILKPFDDLKGPWTLSDDGNYGLYYNDTGNPWQFVLRDLRTKTDYTTNWTSGLKAHMYHARIPADGSMRLFMLEGNEETGRLAVYDMRNSKEIQSFSTMAEPTVIAMNRSLRQSMIAGNSQATTQTQSNQNDSHGTTSQNNYQFDTFDGLLINYQELSLPWSLDYNTIQGRDVSAYKFREKISYGNLEGSGVYAIGKIFNAEGHIGLLSMYRRIYGGADLSWFKMSVFDQQGNHIQTENIGNTQKDASGVSYRVDFNVTEAGDYVTINIRQKENNRIVNKVMTVDKYNGTIKTQ